MLGKTRMTPSLFFSVHFFNRRRGYPVSTGIHSTYPTEWGFVGKTTGSFKGVTVVLLLPVDRG